MAMREEFEREGNWLFRRRSFLPLALIALFLIALPGIDHSGHPEWFHRTCEAVALAVCLMGVSIRVFTIGHAANSTSGRNTAEQIADSVNTTGIYSLVRHPLYLGNYLMWLGLALFTHTWWLVVICTLAFWVYYERIMYAEEEFLRAKFGQPYLDWAAVTPAFIPRLTGYVKPIESFSRKTALRKENDGLFAIVVIMAAFKLFGEVLAHHSLSAHSYWVIAFGVCTLFWATVKILKKKTSVLAGV